MAPLTDACSSVINSRKTVFWKMLYVRIPLALWKSGFSGIKRIITGLGNEGRYLRMS